MGNQTADVKSRSYPTSRSGTLALVLVPVVVLVMLISGFGLIHAAAGTTASTVPMPHAAVAKSTAPASLLSGAGSHPTAVAPSMAQRAQLQQQAVKAAKASHVPNRDFFPPNFVTGVAQNGNVLTSNPAPDTNPVGLGDLGVDNTSGTPVGTVSYSSSWQGTVNINSANALMINNDGPDWYGIQLNTVLTNVTVWGQTQPAYWTQDVFEYSPATGVGVMVDNIWNFSNPTASEPASTFAVYNGTPTGTFYYDELLLPTLPGAFSITLWTNSSNVPYPCGAGTCWNSSVTFGFEIPGVASGNYDRVQFASMASGAIPNTQFEVNGAALTPLGLPWDSELILGGPGGGSSVNFYGYNGTMSMNYWNASTSTYKMAPYVYNYGFDTGETATGIAEHYVVPGTLYLEGGPSIPAKLWGEIPGGNQGTGTIIVNLGSQPTYTFLFAQSGATLTVDGVRWAPTMTASVLTWHLPPGHYSLLAEYSNYDPATSLNVNAPNGVPATWLVGPLTQDFNVGVYTPLAAFSNAQLSAMFYTGTDTIWNNAGPNTYLDPAFLGMNDYMFPEFEGVFLVGTSIHANLTNPAPFAVDFSASAYWMGAFAFFGITTTTNQLDIDLFYTDFASVWGATNLNAWIPALHGFGWPEASIVLWNAADAVIGDNMFADTSNGLLIMNDTTPGGTNTIWGNWFASSMGASFATAPLAIQEYESYDMIWNNYFGTTPEAYSPSMNIYDGLGQTNWNDWNLSGATPVASSTVFMVQGFVLTGAINGALTVCGNVWINDALGANGSIPYNAGGYIWNGGDYCVQGSTGYTFQVTFAETGLVAGRRGLPTWGASIAGGTWTSTSASFAFGGIANGWYHWSAMDVHGYVALPADGNVQVSGAAITITIDYVHVGISISDPVDGVEMGSPVFNVTVNWTTGGTGAELAQMSEDIAVYSADGVDALTTPVTVPATMVSADLNFQQIIAGTSTFAPGCYLLVVGAYNGTTAPAGPATGWPGIGQANICVGTVAISSPAPNGVIPNGSATISYSWSVPLASSAQLTVMDLATGMNILDTSVISSFGALSGSVELPISTGNYTAMLTVTNGFGGSFNTTSTFQVLRAVPPPPAPPPIYYNTTQTTWVNQTAGSGSVTLPFGLDSNVLATLFMEIGLIVGIILGLLVGLMFFARKRTPPMSGSGGSDDTMGGSSSSSSSTSSASSTSSGPSNP